MIVVRLFVDTQLGTARTVLDHALRTVSVLGECVTAELIEPYWKEPGWEEVSFRIDLEEATPLRALYTVLHALGGRGWVTGDDEDCPSAVWTTGEPPIDAAVCFANLEGMHRQ